MMIRGFLTGFMMTGLAMIAGPVTAAEGLYPICDVKVIFNSMCCGVDQATEKRLIEFVQTSDVLNQDLNRRDYWGREGERTYCLYYRDGVSEADKAQLVKDVHKLIKKHPAPNTLTQMELPQKDAKPLPSPYLGR